MSAAATSAATAEPEPRVTVYAGSDPTPGSVDPTSLHRKFLESDAQNCVFGPIGSLFADDDDNLYAVMVDRAGGHYADSIARVDAVTRRVMGAAGGGYGGGHGGGYGGRFLPASTAWVYTHVPAYDTVVTPESGGARLRLRHKQRIYASNVRMLFEMFLERDVTVPGGGTDRIVCSGSEIAVLASKDKYGYANGACPCTAVCGIAGVLYASSAVMVKRIQQDRSSSIVHDILAGTNATGFADGRVELMRAGGGHDGTDATLSSARFDGICCTVPYAPDADARASTGADAVAVSRILIADYGNSALRVLDLTDNTVTTLAASLLPKAFKSPRTLVVDRRGTIVVSCDDPSVDKQPPGYGLHPTSGGSGGLWVLRPSTGRVRHYPRVTGVMAMAVTSANELFGATREHRIVKIDGVLPTRAIEIVSFAKDTLVEATGDYIPTPLLRLISEYILPL